MLQKILTRGILASMLLGASAAYATNGDTLIGVGAKTRSMGGAGIALSHGAESALVNPALITATKSTEVSFGGTVFMPTIETDLGPTGTSTESDADISMIPAVAVSSKVSKDIYMGIGMWGTAGMGTDFRGTPGLMSMETTLQLMQFAVPVAYKYGGLSVGVAPILQYGSLDINYNNGTSVGTGQSQDFAAGVSVGFTYQAANGFAIGGVYKSKIEMEYKGALSTATSPFAPFLGGAMSDILEQPAEIGVGVSYTSGPHSVAIDYKQIQWSDATGYEQFGWEDQNVFAVGYQYATPVWSARVGYNYGSTPITEHDGTTTAGAILNMFNLLGFPATAESHFTAGFTYNFNESFSIDGTIVYAPGATIQLNYKF